MTRLILIGDTGGNANVLRACLERTGITFLTVPSGTTVVHVGDVVRCHSPFRVGNRESVELISALLAQNPTSYLQLLGNHESAALGGPSREGWDVAASLDDKTVEQLHTLWRTGTIHLAASFETAELGSALVTHAGLTRPRWKDLGSPTSALAAAARINDDVGVPLSEWSRAGLLVGDEDDTSDTTWAEVNLEFYEPWIKALDAPFSQLHGHASPFNWEAGDWWPDAPSVVRERTVIDSEQRRTTTLLAPQKYAISVDWNLGNVPMKQSPTWPLLQLNLLPAPPSESRTC